MFDTPVQVLMIVSILITAFAMFVSNALVRLVVSIAGIILWIFTATYLYNLFNDAALAGTIGFIGVAVCSAGIASAIFKDI